MNEKCIAQDDPKERSQMISQMDLIYAGATLTIIAAAGEDCRTGLPGVSNVHRQLQREVKIDQHTTLFELGCWDGAEDIKASKWASRGWTYQECFLSRRRLIFTPKQVIYLCNQTCMPETIERPLETARIPEFKETLVFFIPIFDGGEADNRYRIHLHWQVQEYTERYLSYPEKDYLNAFLGILNHYTRITARKERPILHLGWGLTATTWSWHTKRLAIDLLWYHKSSTIRRLPEFPSWSWTGWNGSEVELGEVWVPPVEPDPQWPDALPLDIFVEHGQHGVISVVEFANTVLNEALARDGKRNDKSSLSQHPGPQTAPRRLRVSCLALPVRIVKRFELLESEQRQKIHNEAQCPDNDGRYSQPRARGCQMKNCSIAVLPIGQGAYVAAIAHLEQQLKQEESILGLLLSNLEDDDEQSATPLGCACLLVRKLGNGEYERLGILLDPFWLSRFTSSNHLNCEGELFMDEEGNPIDKATLCLSGTWYTNMAEMKDLWLV